MVLFNERAKGEYQLSIFDATGTVDELGACIGVARASVVAPNMKQELLGIQQKLFTIGAEVAEVVDRYYHKYEFFCN